MRITAVGFDMGHTLISYDSPLNWNSLYAGALGEVMKKLSIEITSERMETGRKILSAYNTRLHPRETEVSSDVIMGELLSGWNIPLCPQCILQAEDSFFEFFRTGSAPFPDVEPALSTLRDRGLAMGVLTDVAYGMESRYARQDMEPIEEFISALLTSVDIGYRKPNTAGYLKIARMLDSAPSAMLFVGDEEKDIIGAKRCGMIPVLINRTPEDRQYGQQYTIESLAQLPDLLTRISG